MKKNCFVFAMVALMASVQSCSTSNKEEEYKDKIVKTNDEILNKGNVDFADEIFTTGYSGKGPEVIKEFVSSRRKAFPDLRVEVNPVMSQGDMVAWIRTNTGTQSGDYLGHKASNRKITWKDVIITRFAEDGKILEEDGASNIHEMMEAGNMLDGVYEYLSPMKGQSIIRNGSFVYLFGAADGKLPMISQAGIQTTSGDTVMNKITYCTDAKQVGMVYMFRVESWSGDTITYQLMDATGRPTGKGRAVKVSD